MSLYRQRNRTHPFASEPKATFLMSNSCATRERSLLGGLYLFVAPKGGRCWHYRFYFSEKRKKLNLGTYPEIRLECAKARHQYARNLLSHGINPCEMKATLGKNALVLRRREWENARIREGAFNPLSSEIASASSR
jgi:Arm DNA-binding domain